MSRTEHHIGKLNEIYIEHSLDATCQEIVEEANMTDRLSDGYSAKELINDEMDEQYVITEDKIYGVLKSEEIDPNYDIFKASRNEDGTINFEVKYYNGGCGFGEAIGRALKKMEK